ncbi:GAF domain-containing protein [Nocardia paucivorans]|uniref:GAF domain-containing protein n=1 Tax=Nocardia paucivorans TaxID=114259 RepID=UPI0012FAE9E3|nr:GAF domain-containing protein [Nocardia paucivorans]
MGDTTVVTGGCDGAVRGAAPTWHAELSDLMVPLAERLPMDVMVGVTVWLDNEPRVAAWTSLSAKLAEEAQIIAGASPNRDVRSTGRSIEVGDLHEVSLWTECAAELRLLGIRSVYCLPVLVDGTAVAVFDLYTGRVGAFSDQPVPVLVDTADRFAESMRWAVSRP